LGRYLRWQAVIAVLGIVLLGALLRFAAYNFTTITVPEKGGSYIEGVAGNPQYINPLFSQYNQVDATLSAMVFAGLARLDQQGNVVPALAEDLNISPDGLTYDFRLRSGLQWHDGAPITAADVLYTIGVMQSDDFPGVSWLQALWKTVKVEAPEGPDGLAVRFTLQEPLASFLDYTTIGLLPAHLWERIPVAEMMNSQLNSRPVGAGPLMLRQLSATQAELTTFPRYHGAPPYLDGITMRFYPDHQSLLPAYERGEIDGISWIWPVDVAEAAKLKDLQLFTAPLSGYSAIYLNHQNPNTPFFKDQAVRQALMWGLDRQHLIDTAMHGQALVADSPFLPGTWAADPDVPKYGHDPEKARDLLEGSGWIDADGDGIREKDGVELGFVLLGNDQPLIDAIASAWGEIGVRVASEAVTLAGLTGDFLVPRTFDAALVNWELSGDPDPYPLWHSTQIQTGQNYGGWDNRETDEKIERARNIFDRTQRREDYLRFQRLFADQLPALLLYHPVYTFGVREKVHDVQAGPMNGPADRFRNFAEWYIVTKRITVGKGN
jgi:peptide/nickel transport system substrate-binding protein